VPGPPWWHGKLNHGKFGFDSLTCLMGLDLVVEGTWLKASSASEELKVGSWGWGGFVNLSQGDISCCFAKRFWGQPQGCPGATLGVVSYFPVRQLGVVSEKALCCLETFIKCCLFGCLGLIWSCPENWLLQNGLHYIKT
jgi:hypothetical protein